MSADLHFIHLTARRDGGRFRLAYIPDDFDEVPTEPFDEAYMKSLYARAFLMGREGYPWASKPPGWQSAEDDER